MPTNPRFPAALLALAASLASQSVVVPSSFATTRGTGGANTILRDAGNPRTYMVGLPAAELAGIPVGATIVGISFRAQVSTTNAASWPPSNASWASYDVSLGTSAPLASWSTTFASNFAGAPVVVRSGPLVLEAGSFVNLTSLPSPQPNPWSTFYWDFQTPYTYVGGDLAILMTHTGSSLSGNTLFTDYQTSLTTIKAMTASQYQATTGTAILSPAIMRLHLGYGAGCAGTAGLVPWLVLTNGTQGGGPTTYAFGNAPPNAPAAVSLGVGRTSIPLPGGCPLLTLPLVAVPLTLGSLGRGALTLTVPVGALGTIDGQGFVVDAGVPSGFTVTNGVTLVAR